MSIDGRASDGERSFHSPTGRKRSCNEHAKWDVLRVFYVQQRCEIARTPLRGFFQQSDRVLITLLRDIDADELGHRRDLRGRCESVLLILVNNRGAAADLGHGHRLCLIG
jgi:hypothetical protein